MPDRPIPPRIHVLAKPSGATCNLACSYCFFLDKELLYPGSKFRMSEETLEAYICQLIETHRSNQVSVSWQGREPTLMGVDFYRKAIRLQEAERNRALPLLGGMAVFFGILPPMPTVTRFSFAGDVQNVSTTVIPRIYGRSYAIEAELEVPEGGAEGVLCAFADFIGGFSLWVDEKGHLIHTYQFLGVDTYKQVSTEPIPTGDVTVKMLFEIDEPKPGAGGKVTLWANDKQIGEGTMPHSVAMLFTTYAAMDMGRDNGGVVDLAYEDKAPYAFTGKLKKVVFDLKPVHAAAEQDLHQHAMAHAVAAGAAG